MILTRTQVREIDRIALEEFGIPGIVLMENAGRGAAEVLLKRSPSGTVLIVAGKGNNAGDGFVVARNLEFHRIPVEVFLVYPPESFSGDALTNLRIVQRSGIPIYQNDLESRVRSCEWIVDGLLGTGASGIVRDPIAKTIRLLNNSNRPIFALDLPSGLDCETGLPLGEMIHAQMTATFVARKPGFLNPQAVAALGEVHVVDIGIPRLLLDRYTV